MKANKLIYAALVAVPVSLFGCGGGGGSDGGSTPDASPTATATPAPTPPPCPTGPAQEVGKVCPLVIVAVADTKTLSGSVVSPVTAQSGLTVPFTGTLSKADAVLWQGTVGGSGVAFNGSTTVAGGIVTFVSKVRPTFGKPSFLVITGEDSLGRAVTTTIAFATSAMTCVDIKIWSNPANFSTPLQTCVAPIGVQALVTPSLNTLQDNSCVITVGVPFTAACQSYLANGTMLLVDTPIVVNGHAVKWDGYVDLAGKGNVVLLDTNDVNNPPIPLGMKVLPASFVWEIGNPTGENINLTTSVAGVTKQVHVAWDPIKAEVVITCAPGVTPCP